MQSRPSPGFVSAPYSERRRSFGLLVLIAAWWLCGLSVGFEPGLLFQPDGLSNASALIQGLLNPTFEADFVQRVLRLSVESFAIGVTGLALALFLGVPLGLLGARLPRLIQGPSPNALQDFFTRWVRPVSRLVLTILRSIPEIIWAFLFVRILGLGPGPAVLAIGLSFAGIIGKLFAELMESAAPEPGQSLRRIGVSPFGVAFYGVLPQVRHQWVGYGLFRLECAIRSAAILGVVGAGGLGTEIDLSIRYFEYDKLGTALIALLVSIFLLEIVSRFLRKAATRWSLIVVSLGAVLGSWSLGITWLELFSMQALEQMILFVQGFSDPSLDTQFIWASVIGMLETIGMALFATAGAALCAFVLAPLGAWQIVSFEYLKDAPKGAKHQGIFWGLMGMVRGLFQMLRAMPELVWALIFVVWIGAGSMAGMMAIGVHTVGILGRLFGEVYEDIEERYPRALEARGAGRMGGWAYGVLPQALPQLLSFSLFRFEVNIRATAMVGFVGAGGIGDAIHTAISLFHFRELATLLIILVLMVSLVDALSSALRFKILER